MVGIEMHHAIRKLFACSLAQVFLADIGDRPGEIPVMQLMARRKRQYLVIQHVAVLALAEERGIVFEGCDDVSIRRALAAVEIMPKNRFPFSRADPAIHVPGKVGERADPLPAARDPAARLAA